MPTDRDWAIRRLEHWHRVWEINHPERLAEPTFASAHDLTHEHRFEERISPRTGQLYQQCELCPKMKFVK